LDGRKDLFNECHEKLLAAWVLRGLVTMKEQRIQSSRSMVI